jgi:hypothetical protein
MVVNEGIDHCSLSIVGCIGLLFVFGLTVFGVGAAFKGATILLS